ncbi:UDPglucose 6-dehydrogenase [Oceanospirillum multiglobuliferum]|uniref:UDP-glucose 6-dehydrogenase n=1 Tax=Oceanospirillum multiglobuliferum TaxID=64969 RepID=A0A1T4NZ55_9GAMM|nr:UDP-glucose/GDP-mannose dehydrogenase family protein [Oceanospirillum multiglobuliferum]OPX55074.1 UDP-glucose 6-dehydrogenase [Oceanospirillum multiglobuliferum]SJZ84495.1 UDPglucose 6-dehydrogenase [Oceanospirillum multiglobuliferum]
MNIAIFGSGYVGLVTGACLADVGHKVSCIDIDSHKIEHLNQGNIPIYEPGLEALINRNRQEGLLSFTTDAKQAVQRAELIFIAVGTPSDQSGQADLRSVFAVADSIADYMNNYKVVISKSTVPVGTTEQIKQRIVARQQHHNHLIDFDVCSNPEFLKEGSAIEDFTRAARIIIGTDSQRVTQLMSECYAPYNRNRNKLMFLDIRASELTKYAANAMLATKISFMNEIANLAEHLQADIEQVRQGIGSDPRIGFDFIYPGCGYGGSCFPKDVSALLNSATLTGVNLELLQSVQRVNERQKHLLFDKLNQVFNGQWHNKTIAIWGLAFKPNTDDMREAPSRILMEAIWQAGGRVQAFDPIAMPECKKLYSDESKLTLCEQRDACVDNADALVICTEWKAFRTVDFEWLKQQLKTPVVVDGRNLFEPKRVQQAGLLYYAVGRGNSVYAS